MTANLLQVLKVDDAKSGVSKFGKPYTLQEAHCILLNDDTTVKATGRFMVPRDKIGKLLPGHYRASYELDTDREGRVTAMITELDPVRVEGGKITALPPLKAA